MLVVVCLQCKCGQSVYMRVGGGVAAVDVDLHLWNNGHFLCFCSE